FENIRTLEPWRQGFLLSAAPFAGCWRYYERLARKSPRRTVSVRPRGRISFRFDQRGSPPSRIPARSSGANEFSDQSANLPRRRGGVPVSRSARGVPARHPRGISGLLRAAGGGRARRESIWLRPFR